jgi:hypothetical protein
VGEACRDRLFDGNMNAQFVFGIVFRQGRVPAGAGRISESGMFINSSIDLRFS